MPKPDPQYQPTKPLPTTVNGYHVFASRPLPPGDGCTRAGEVIAVDAGRGEEERYVVACLYWCRQEGRWDSQWNGGCYRRTLSDAAEAFDEHVKRLCR